MEREPRQKRLIKVHIHNEKGEESIVPFDAMDYSTDDKNNLEIIIDNEEGNEEVIATFNDWTFVEIR